MTGIGTLAQVDPRGKTVLLRLDLNSPMDPVSREILDDKRFREHLPTIRHLAESRLVTSSPGASSRTWRTISRRRRVLFRNGPP